MNDFISLRDYFAAKAMSALIISQPNTAINDPDKIVKLAQDFADMMLKQHKIHTTI